MRALVVGLAAAALFVTTALAAVMVEIRPASDVAGEGLEPISAADGYTVHVAAEVIIGNADIERANAAVDPYTGAPVVYITLSREGAGKLADYTAGHVGDLVAIVVDGKLISAPRINEPILGGQMQISGSMTTEEAERIAAGLNP